MAALHLLAYGAGDAPETSPAMPSLSDMHATLVPFLLMFGYVVACFTGDGAQLNIAAKFAAAILNGDKIVRAGGVRWALLDDGFWRVMAIHSDGKILVNGALDRHTRREKQRASAIVHFLGVSLCALWLLGTNGEGLVAGWPLGFFDADDTNGMLNLCFLVGGVVFVAMEVAFRQGWQPIWGAMVLDPEFDRAGFERVRQQKVQGSARLAGEAEAQAAARGGGQRGSSVHEQEF
jgi:hypothetical protein